MPLGFTIVPQDEPVDEVAADLRRVLPGFGQRFWRDLAGDVLGKRDIYSEMPNVLLRGKQERKYLQTDQFRDAMLKILSERDGVFRIDPNARDHYLNELRHRQRNLNRDQWQWMFNDRMSRGLNPYPEWLQTRGDRRSANEGI